MTDEPTTIVLLLLPDVATARRAAHDLREADAEGRLHAEDWLIVEHRNGKLHLHRRAATRPATGFAGGALLGGVAGLLLGAVVAPALIVGTLGAVAASLTERGLPKDVVEQVGAALGDGQAALFVLADANSARIIGAETFANSTVATWELHPDDAAAVTEVAAEVAATVEAP